LEPRRELRGARPAHRRAAAYDRALALDPTLGAGDVRAAMSSRNRSLQAAAAAFEKAIAIKSRFVPRT